MTVNWTDLQDLLPELISDLLGGMSVQWGDQPRKMIAGPHAALDILAPSSIGVDDVTWSDVGAEPDEQLRATVTGQRIFTLQVSLWSARQTLADSARRHLEQLRTRIRLPSTLARLRALGLAHVGTEAIVDVDPVQDNRVISQSTIDLRFAYAAVEHDEPIPYIETAHIESESFRNAAGDPFPDSLQIDINPPEP